MQRAMTPDPTKATMGLRPYTTKNFVQFLFWWMSTIHMIVAIATLAMPAQKRTYELVQMLLLIGNDQFHIRPPIIASAPPANSPLMRSTSGRLSEIHRPVRMPSMHMPIAGIVEKIPSGSQVTLLTQV